MTPILILAAGASARMAPRDKLLEQVAGEALLRRTARIATATGAPVLVALPPDRPDRAAVLAGLAVVQVPVERAAEGMAASLSAGVAALPPNALGVMVLPADMPGLQTGDLCALLEAFGADPAAPLRATSATGQPGHPVIFPAALFPALRTLTGDEGGRAVLRQAGAALRLIALPGDRATLDLDTPADWAAFRARLDSPG